MIVLAGVGLIRWASDIPTKDDLGRPWPPRVGEHAMLRKKTFGSSAESMWRNIVKWLGVGHFRCGFGQRRTTFHNAWTNFTSGIWTGFDQIWTDSDQHETDFDPASSTLASLAPTLANLGSHFANVGGEWPIPAKLRTDTDTLGHVRPLSSRTRPAPG